MFSVMDFFKYTLWFSIYSQQSYPHFSPSFPIPSPAYTTLQGSRGHMRLGWTDEKHKSRGKQIQANKYLNYIYVEYMFYFSINVSFKIYFWEKLYSTAYECMEENNDYMERQKERTWVSALMFPIHANTVI